MKDDKQDFSITYIKTNWATRKKKILIILVIVIISISLFTALINYFIFFEKYDGIVIDTNKSYPISNVDIEIFRVDDEGGYGKLSDHIKTVSTDDNGKFSVNLRRINNGYYVFIAKKTRYYDPRIRACDYPFEENVSMIADYNNHVQIEMISTCGFRGTIVDSDMKPVENAIIVVDNSNLHSDRFQIMTRSNSSGFFLFNRIPTGYTNFIISHNKYETKITREIPLHRSEEFNITYTLNYPKMEMYNVTGNVSIGINNKISEDSNFKNSLLLFYWSNDYNNLNDNLFTVCRINEKGSYLTRLPKGKFIISFIDLSYDLQYPLYYRLNENEVWAINRTMNINPIFIRSVVMY